MEKFMMRLIKFIISLFHKQSENELKTIYYKFQVPKLCQNCVFFEEVVKPFQIWCTLSKNFDKKCKEYEVF